MPRSMSLGMTTNPTPAQIRANHALNEERLRVARNFYGYVRIRWYPQVQGPKTLRQMFLAIRGQALLIKVDEVIDVWDLLRDLKAFLVSWRPMRRRTPGAQVAAKRVLEEWTRLAGQVR